MGAKKKNNVFWDQGMYGGCAGECTAMPELDGYPGKVVEEARGA